MILGLSLPATFSGEVVSQLLRYNRGAILSGEVWRLLTAHFVHGSPGHWLLDISGLLLVWALFRQWMGGWQDIVAFFVISAGVSLGVLLLNPHTLWFVGLSGVLHGLFAMYLVIGLWQGDRTLLVLLGALIGKLAYEQAVGALPGSEQVVGMPVLVDAHLYGAITGALWGVVRARRQYSEEP